MDRIGIKQDEDMWYGMTIRLRNFAARVSAATRSFGQWAGVALLLVLSLDGATVYAQTTINPARPAYNVRRIYVSPQGAGTFDGSSWANAAKGSDLQMILGSTDTWNNINSTLQIWVAAGTYVPTEPQLPGDERSASFVLKGNQVVVYGGFRGQVFDDLGTLIYAGENSLDERVYGNVYSGNRQEPWAFAYQTIFSGDRLGNDNLGDDTTVASLDPSQNTTRADNLNTVVTFDPSSVDVTLDGITVTGGSASGTGEAGYGGGVLLDGTSCGIERCLLNYNFAARGGAVYIRKNSGSDSQRCFVYGSVMVSNSALNRYGYGYGGGIYSETGVIFNNLIYNNNGGGICAYDATSIVNNTVVNNQLYGIGRPDDTDMPGTSITVSNTVVWSIDPLNHVGLSGFGALTGNVSNCAIVNWNEEEGTDNISLEAYNDQVGKTPNFVNPTAQVGVIQAPAYADLAPSFLLQQNSALLSNAESSWMTTLNIYYGTDVSFDIAGNPRVVSQSLDIGAYQYQPVAGGNILYVRQLRDDEPELSPGEVRDGSSWRLALQDVQMAIDQLYARNVIGEVWVAGGTYYPTTAFTDETGTKGNTERHRSFVMRSGISVYGGFRGETGDEGINNSTTRPLDPDHSDAPWAFANRTIFSGDVDHNDDAQKGWRWNAGSQRWESYYGRNSYHVVWFASEGFYERTTQYEPVAAKPLTVETTLDGVVITGGCADYGERGESTRMGAGVYLVEKGVVSNCIIYQNYALTRGGGVMMNNGGMLTNSLVMRNASPGVQVRNGFGGGVYLLGDGTVFRTIVTNNTARVGAGIYVDEAEYNNPDYDEMQENMYRGVLSDVLVSNNTAASDAGAIYFDRVGGISSSTVVKNYCTAVASDQDGNSGGMVVDGYGIVYNTVLWGNATIEHTRQFFGENGRQATASAPASIQVYNTALQNLSNTIWGVNTVTQKTYALADQNAKGTSSSTEFNSSYPEFSNPAVDGVDVVNGAAGVYQTASDDVAGTQTLDGVLRTIYDVQWWIPSDQSTLQRKGGTSSDAPYVRYTPVHMQFYIPATDILSKAYVEPRVLGAFTSDRPTIQYSVIEDNGVEKLVIFVDPTIDRDLSGASWDSPMISGNQALEYLASLPATEYPGAPREVWVKEGVIHPVWRAVGSDRRTSSVVLRGGVSLYGGFNSKLIGTEGSTTEGETFVPAGGSDAEPMRNPVDYRTVFDGTLAGGNLYHVVTMSDEGTAVIDGFHIVNGDAADGSSVIKSGGGILHENGTLYVRNCMIENNIATNGAGVTMLGATKKLVMTNTVVNNNTNTGLSSDPLNAAVVLKNDARLNHCTVIHNNAPGICAADGQLMLYNSVLWGNTSTGTIAATDLQITGMATSMDIRNNAIQYAPEGWALWSDNLQLSIVPGDPMYPAFVNPTRSVGAVASGYDTPLGGPARFEPSCESPLVIAGDESVVGDPDLLLDADITGHHYVVGGAPDIGAYEATCLNPIGSVVYVRSGPAGTASNPQTTYFGTGDGSSWSNAINGNAWYGFDDGLPYDQIEYNSNDATDYITGLQYAVNMAYKASLKKEADGSIAYTPLNYYELAGWSNQQRTSINIPEVDTTALVEVWVAEGEYTSRRGFFMRDAVQVYGGFPGTGTPGKEERNPRVYTTVIQTMTTAEATQVDATGENHSLYGPICGFSKQNSYELNSGYVAANKTRRVLTQPFPYYERTKQGNFSYLSSTELANRPLNPFVIETIWDGFIIQNGRTRINHGKDGGAGVALRKNGRLENCVIRNNINYVPNSTGAGPADNPNAVQGRGGAAFCNDGVFSNCSFFSNKLGPQYCENYGGAIYMRAGTAYNCVFVGNVANTGTAWGSAVYLEVGSFYNNTVSDNSGSVGAIYGGNWFLENGGGASEMKIYNTIVYHNTGASNQTSYQIYKAANCTMTLSRCCVPASRGYINNGNLTVEGLITADPQFVDRTPANKEDANYRLQGTSPCINAGNNNPEGITLPETDMDYTDRFKDCSIDIGAYEIDQSEPILPAIKTIDGEEVGVIYVTKAANGTVDGSSWTNAACEAKLQKALNWAGYIIHNKDTYNGGKYRNISRIQVHIASGTYYPTDAVLPDQPRTTTFIIPAGIEVYGGFAGADDNETLEGRNIQLNRTVFSGMVGSSSEEDVYRVVTFGMKQHSDNASVPAEGATYYDDPNPEIATLDGVYIVNGNANHPSDAEWQSGGGAKVTANGLLQNCIVYDCAASDKGGGVYLAPGGRVTGSVIYANESANGGGIYADDNSMVVNCTVVGNTSTSDGVGGGISVADKPIVLNSVFWMNDSGNGKNIYGNMSQEVDTTFAGVKYQSYIFSHCAVEGLKVIGYGNMALTSLNANTSTIVGLNTPGFIDPDNHDYTLKRISSLIRSGIRVEQPDAALMEALHISRLDLLGTNRYYEPDGSALRDYFDVGALTYNGPLVIEPSGVTDAEQGGQGVYRLYVSQTAQGLATGHSWRNALGDIQQALDYFANDANFVNDPQAANRKCEIWVSKGTFNPKTAVKADNTGASFVLNRYTSIYGGFRGSNLPYYESWIEQFKTDPSNRIDATGTWNKDNYSYTLGGDGTITFHPDVKALSNEPASWFLHFVTDETSASSLKVLVNGINLPDELALPVISTDSTTEYVYDLRFLAIGNTDRDTAPVIENIRVAGLSAGTTLYSATIDNRKSATTTAAEIVATDVITTTLDSTPVSLISMDNLSQASQGSTYSSYISNTAAVGNTAGEYGMQYCPNANRASIGTSGSNGVELSNTRQRTGRDYAYYNTRLGAYFRFPQAVEFNKYNSASRYLHATVRFSSLNVGSRTSQMQLQLYAVDRLRKSLTFTIPSGISTNRDYSLTADLYSGRVYVNGTAVSASDYSGTPLASGDMLSVVTVAPYYNGQAAYTVTVSDISINNVNQEGQTALTEDINIVTEDKTESFSLSDQYYAGESFTSERPRQDWNGNGLLEDFEYSNETILSGDVGGGTGTAHVAYYNDANASERVLLDGLKLIKGNTLCADHGGGALCALSPITLRNCQLLLNESSFGGGAVYASDIEIYGSILGGNSATGKSGGAIYLREGGRSQIVNTVIYNNTASVGSGYYAETGTESQLVNNTIVRNSSDGAATGCTVYATSATGNNLTNTVLWGNDDAECINTDNWEIVTSAADVDESVGNFEVFLDQANAAVMGPRFGFPSDYAGAENYFAMADFSLPSLSTLVNRGTNGGTRKLNTNIVMNPDGSVQSSTITTDPVVLDGSGKGYYAAQNQWGRENVPDTLNGKWRITKEPDTYHIIKQNGVDMIDVKEWKEGVIDIGAYEYESVSLTPFGGNILYVKSTETVSDKENNGVSWEQATSNIYQAIQVLLLSPNQKDKYIKIASGEYVPYLKDEEGGYSFVVSKPYVENLGNMTKSLTFRGGYPDNITGTDVTMDNLRDPVLYPTYIRGNRDDSKHLMYIDKSMDTAGENGEQAPIYIEGITFLEGNASDATGEGATGAAIYAGNTNTTIRNSMFVSNRAAGEQGAAVYLNKGYIYNSVFHTNEAWGIAMNGSGNIISNTIADNTRGGLYARGASAADPLQVYNNIFWRNYAGQTPSAGDLTHQLDVDNATLYSNAIQIADESAEVPNAVYAYWNPSARVVLGDKAANLNKTLSSDNENMSYGPRFEAPDESEPLNKKYGIRPGRKLINTGFRYMAGETYDKEENDRWYTDLFAYYPFGSVDEPVAAGDSLARVMFVDAGGSRRIAGNSIDIGAYEYQRLFYPNLYVKPDGYGLGSSWDDAMGDLQEAVYSAYYSGDPEESGTYGTVWVAGGDYVLPTTLQWMANVKVYGGFRGTNETSITQRQGLLEENAPNSILSVEAEGVPVVRSDNDRLAGTVVENWAELNGFYIKGGKNSPAVIAADSFAITNSVIYDNVNPDGVAVESDGLLYNVLLHDNEVASHAVELGEHGAAVHVTAVGEGTQIAGEGRVVNSINGTATTVDGAPYTPHYVATYLPDETHLRYQLSDRDDTPLFSLGALQEPGANGTTVIDGYTVPKIRNGNDYDDIINLSTDCDVLGNKRMLGHKALSADGLQRPDYGCFETWNTADNLVVNLNDTDYPRAGSVVYVGKSGELRMTAAFTRTFSPSFLLLRHAAGLRAGNHAVSLYNLAIERDLSPLIDASTASWDMVGLPFSLSVGGGSLQNGITIDGNSIEAIEASNAASGNGRQLYLYKYDGAKRAEDLYSAVAPQNSKYWTFENSQIGANVGYLMATPEATDAVTVRFTKSSSALPVYEETADGAKSLYLRQYNLKNVVNGRPQFTYKENMGWNLFGIPYLCSYTSEQMSIDHILYSYDPAARSFVTLNSWEGNTIAPFSAVFTQTATLLESEELTLDKPAIPLTTSPAPHGLRLSISGNNPAAGSDCVSLVADVVEGEPMAFDMSNDALKMMSFDPRVPQIYVYNTDGVRFAHTQTADVEGETPLGVYTGEAGIYEIALTDDSDYDRYERVILSDHFTGSKVDLKEGSYSFTVDDKANENGRFTLTFGKLDDEMLSPSFYSPEKRRLRVVNLQGGETIRVYDTLGREQVVRRAAGATDEFEIESGVYVVRIGQKNPVKGKVVVK